MKWTIQENGMLEKTYIQESFLKVIDSVNKISLLAEKSNHHPDILIHSYNKLTIRLFTHDSGKVTEKDHKMAGQIDELLTSNQ